MFRRRSCRIAHRSDSSSDGTPSPLHLRSSTRECCNSTPKKLSFSLRRQLLIIPSLRLRIPPVLRLLKIMSRRVLVAMGATRKAKVKKNHNFGSKPRAAMGFSVQCTRSSCTPDAIADCIEFIKRSASCHEPNSPSSSSSCSSSSHSHASLASS